MPIHLNPLHKPPTPKSSTDINSDASDLYLLPAIASIHFNAFIQTPLFAAIWPGPPSTYPGIIEANLNRHRQAFLEDPGCYITTCVGCDEPERGEEWEAVGFVKWKVVGLDLSSFGSDNNASNSTDTTAAANVGAGGAISTETTAALPAPSTSPSNHAPGGAHDTQRTFPEGTNMALVDWYWARLLANRQRMTTQLGGPHVFVDYLAVDPAWQKRGVGKLLMQDCVADADRRGLPMWIEASMEGRPLYESMGFRGVEELWVDLDRFEGGVDRGEGWRKEAGREDEVGRGGGWYMILVMVRDVVKR
jgi:GNAT superfamily N-acetyltransferase